MHGESKPKPTERWGFTSKTKFALVEIAPFTASGLNEVIATGRTRSEVLAFAKLLGIKVTSTRYQIVKAEELWN